MEAVFLWVLCLDAAKIESEETSPVCLNKKWRPLHAGHWGCGSPDQRSVKTNKSMQM